LVWKGYSPLLTGKTMSSFLKQEPRKRGLKQTKVKKLIPNPVLSTSAFKVKPQDVSKENLLFINNQF
jgi:hypothetical protein